MTTAAPVVVVVVVVEVSNSVNRLVGGNNDLIVNGFRVCQLGGVRDNFDVMSILFPLPANETECFANCGCVLPAFPSSASS